MRTLDNFSRFAVYYVPPKSDHLAKFAAAWFGWDIYQGMKVNYPKLHDLNYHIKEITSIPGKYGLHGTLKAPFFLAHDKTIEELRLSMSLLARSIKKFEIPSICLGIIDEFIAIVPTSQNESIHSLAKKCLEDLDSFREAESDEILNKRRSGRLSTSEEHNLLKWGYPYVLDDFQFHLTMTGKLPLKVCRHVFSVLNSELQEVLNAPLFISKICLVGENKMDGKFGVIEEFSLVD